MIYCGKNNNIAYFLEDNGSSYLYFYAIDLSTMTIPSSQVIYNSNSSSLTPYLISTYGAAFNGVAHLIKDSKYFKIDFINKNISSQTLSQSVSQGDILWIDYAANEIYFYDYSSYSIFKYNFNSNNLTKLYTGNSSILSNCKYKGHYNNKVILNNSIFDINNWANGPLEILSGVDLSTTKNSLDKQIIYLPNFAPVSDETFASFYDFQDGELYSINSHNSANTYLNLFTKRYGNNWIYGETQANYGIIGDSGNFTGNESKFMIANSTTNIKENFVYLLSGLKEV